MLFKRGDHAPADDTVRAEKGIGSRFLLMDGKREDASVMEAAQRFAESMSDIAELRFTDCDDTSLVRPDGYVAYSTNRGTGTAALNSVRSLLARQIH